MRRVRSDELGSGMIIARSVVGADGRVLLTQNTVLTDMYIKKLGSLGLGSIYVKDVLSDDEIPEIISNKVMVAVSSSLKESVNTFTHKGTLDLTAVRKSISMLLDDIISNRHVMLQLEDVRTYNDYLLFHSINVAVLSIMTGVTLQMSEGQLMDIGMGGLLHDIGMIAIDPNILNKAEALDQAEAGEIQKHPEVGFNILRSYREVSTMAAHMAYQHHERYNSTGYPRQLPYDHIVDFAKICAVVDTFDAVISDRPYRKGYSMEEAVIVLRKLSGRYFQPEFVEAFVSNIANYPVGCLVVLNTGFVGVVTQVTRNTANRPQISVIADADGNFIKPFMIDLATSHEVSIRNRMSTEDTNQFREKFARWQAMTPR
ncbi:MAG: HD-GYP domain-containing protein [Solirubrobacterales bacterium]